MDRGVDLPDLLHHRLVDRQPSGGIDYQYILVMRLGVLQRGVGNIDRLLRAIGREKIDTNLRRKQLELLDGRRSIDVARDQQDFFLLFQQQLCQLTRGGGLARALQAGHQDHRRRLRGQVERGVFSAHQRGQLAMHHRHERLPRRETAYDFFA